MDATGAQYNEGHGALVLARLSRTKVVHENRESTFSFDLSQLQCLVRHDLYVYFEINARNVKSPSFVIRPELA